MTFDDVTDESEFSWAWLWRRAPQRGLEAGIDFERANAARMYDYFLGGSHNFAVDRAQAKQVLASYPHAVWAARSQRAFLGRVVGFCLEQGIDQFLDLGSGVPTAGNVHEIALDVAPVAKVAYVDFEPVAVAHAREIVADLDTVGVTRADLRDVDRVLHAPEVAELLDFGRPVAVLAVAVLHFVPEDIARILARYRAALVPGSVVALTHASDDLDDAEVGAAIRAGAEAYRGSATEMTLRPRHEVAALLDGLDVVEPGLVDLTDWPVPDPESAPAGGYAAVSRVR